MGFRNWTWNNHNFQYDPLLEPFSRNARGLTFDYCRLPTFMVLFELF